MTWGMWRSALFGAAAVLLAAAAAWLMLERDAPGAQPGVAGVPIALPRTAFADPAVAPVPTVDAAQASAGTASGVAAAQDPHALFMEAVKTARERPQPPPPPAIAQAKSFPEAFAAMQAAQREAERTNPPPGTAAVNPFAAR